MISQDLLIYNKKVIYHIPKRYKYLNLLMSDNELRDLFFKILNYLSDKELYKFNNELSFHLATKTLRTIRGKGSEDTVNRYMNYLVALGLFNKHEQRFYRTELTKINQKLLDKANKEHKKIRPMNIFFIKQYTKDQLELIEQRAKMLFLNNIKKSNISKEYLICNNLSELSDLVYPTVNFKTNWYQDSFNKIHDFIELELSDKGYTTKQELVDNVIINEDHNQQAISKVLKQFKMHLTKEFNYKRPNQTEKDKYNLQSDKYIYVKK